MAPGPSVATHSPGTPVTLPPLAWATAAASEELTDRIRWAAGNAFADTLPFSAGGLLLGPALVLMAKKLGVKAPIAIGVWLGVAIGVVFFLLPDDAQDVLYVVIGLAAVAAVLHGARARAEGRLSWQLFAAGASMAVLVTAFSLLTDSLRDALDPKLK